MAYYIGEARLDAARGRLTELSETYKREVFGATRSPFASFAALSHAESQARSVS